jgi:hypothetical protein
VVYRRCTQVVFTIQMIRMPNILDTHLCALHSPIGEGGGEGGGEGDGGGPAEQAR